MAKQSTYPNIIDNLLKFSVSNLKKQGLLIHDTEISSILTWKNKIFIQESIVRNTLTIIVNKTNDNNYIQLQYSINNMPYDYKVELIERPSNLGKGVITYFQCPSTGNSCLKLYLHNNIFVCRSAIEDCCYEDQAISKKHRLAGSFIRFLLKRKSIIDQRQRPYHKVFYKGRLTKRHLKIVSADKELGSYLNSIHNTL